MGVWLLALVFVVSGSLTLNRAKEEAQSEDGNGALPQNRVVLAGLMLLLGLLVTIYGVLELLNR